MFCILALAWPEQTSTVQTVGTEMENHARRFVMQIEMENEMPINHYKLSGSCGDLVNWYLTEEGTMYLQGEGAMWDYADSPLNVENSPVPQWYDYREEITTLVVMPGITSIGGNAFYKCVNLKECTFPDSLKEICYGAFRYCDGLIEVVLPDTVSEIGFSAFMGCDNLTLVFEGSNPTWVLNELNANLFFDDTRVEIYYPAPDESWKDFNSEGKGGMIYMTPYSGEEVYKANSNLLLGDRITLGYYEQDDNPENGSEPIEWGVPGVTEEKAFLTTAEQLTVRSEIETEAAVDWG